MKYSILMLVACTVHFSSYALLGEAVGAATSAVQGTVGAAAGAVEGAAGVVADTTDRVLGEPQPIVEQQVIPAPGTEPIIEEQAEIIEFPEQNVEVADLATLEEAPELSIANKEEMAIQ